MIISCNAGFIKKMGNSFKIVITVYLVLCFSFQQIPAQDAERFRNEVNDISSRNKVVRQEALIIFTGSSSIRLWKNIDTCFPGKNILNTGFGSSQMSDLLYYADELIIKYRPVQVIIYEGDNDLSAGKAPSEITKDAVALCDKVRKDLPEVIIVFIAAKPSPSRWALKDKYIELNRMLRDLPKDYKQLFFADIWPAMINSSGRPEGSLFNSDSLHMNAKGYALWSAEIGKYILK